MREAWERIQLGLHLLLLSAGIWMAMIVANLWTGGYDPFGISGINRLAGLGIAGLLLSARLLLLAAGGLGLGALALSLDLLAWATPLLGLAVKLSKALGLLLHALAWLVSLVQLRGLARELQRPDLARWVRRLAGLLGAALLGLGLAAAGPASLAYPGLGLAAGAGGLAWIRYLRLLKALGAEVSRDLSLLRAVE